MNKYNWIFDIDGVFTDGTFYYSQQGKIMKKFGADDSDALKLIKDDINLIFVSSDHRGFNITKKRINDMGYELLNVPGNNKRLQWIKNNYNLDKVIYMGDAFTDAIILKEVKFGIVPADASIYAKNYADYICKSDGGHRAVAQAVFVVAEKFLNKSFQNLIGIK